MMMRRMFVSCCGVCLLADAGSAVPDALPLRTYLQQVEVEYATADDARGAVMGLAPVYDGRDWAFSARWDDCNTNSLQMRLHMAKFGLKGSFYLTQNDDKNRFDKEFCRQLMQDGCSIAGHTMTHPRLPDLNAGAIWWQIMANRVAREDNAETPLNTFAFSGGMYKSDKKPEAFRMISEAVRRAGYHHCVYADFVRDNPNLAPGELSTGWQVRPGDRAVKAGEFQEELGKVTSGSPGACSPLARCIFLGVHPWQTGKEWDKLDEVFKTISGKPEWWYCNMTEWAAYARQVARSELKAGTGAALATVRRYALTRPAPGELGAAVPLTCLIGKANVKAVKMDGQSVPFEKRGSKVLVNLPHGRGQALPQRIGHIDVPVSEQKMADNLQCADFPQIKGLLIADLKKRKLRLTLEAQASSELRDLYIRFRLPLQYEPGLVIKTIECIKAGASQVVEIELPAPKPEAFWAEGPQYWVAEVDFNGPASAGRLFVTQYSKEK